MSGACWRRHSYGAVALGLALAFGPGCQGRKEPPAALQDLQLVDQHGREVSESQLAGEVLVLSFMFTRCPSVCPKLTQLLADARARLPADVRDRVRFLSVSVDPENDTPHALQTFAKRYGADVPEWSFVRVDESALKILSSRLGVFEPGATPAPSAHAMSVFLFDRRGRPVQRYAGTTTAPEQLAREIVALDALRQPGASGDGERSLRSAL